MAVVGVKFRDNGKTYFFNANIKIDIGDFCLVDTEKGLQLAKVYTVTEDEEQAQKAEREVIRKATKQDYEVYLDNLKLSKEVTNATRKKVDEEGLSMHIVDSNYTFDKKQLTINFVSDERVDFRELVKYLAAKYKTHIELHQMGVRDKAKEIGGIGQCGLPLCCTSFKKSIDGISINMAKNQNLSLNPSKINGCCGRLLCCLSYENKVYSDGRKNLPKIDDEIVVNNKKCKVKDINILTNQVIVEQDGENIVVDYNEK